MAVWQWHQELVIFVEPYGPPLARFLSGFETPLCGRIAFMADTLLRTVAAPGRGNGITASPCIESMYNARFRPVKFNYGYGND